MDFLCVMPLWYENPEYVNENKNKLEVNTFQKIDFSITKLNQWVKILNLLHGDYFIKN